MSELFILFHKPSARFADQDGPAQDGVIRTSGLAFRSGADAEEERQSLARLGCIVSDWAVVAKPAHVITAWVI